MRLPPVLTLIIVGPVLLVSLNVGARERSKADETARNFFRAGERDYAVGRYEDAAHAFEEAYRLSQRAKLLFNLGNTYERMGKHREAADYLTRFLEQSRDSLTPVDVIALQGRISRLRQTAAVTEAKAKAEHDQAAARAREEAEQRRALENAEREADEARRRAEEARWERDQVLEQPVEVSAQLNWPLWISGAGGVAGVGTAIVFGVLLAGAKGRTDESCRDSGGGVLCQSNGIDAVRDQQRFALGTDIATTVGVVGAGLALYFFLTSDELPEEPATGRLQVLVGEDRAGLGLVGSF